MTMRKILSVTILTATLLGAGSCKKESEFLNVLPTSILTNDQAFSDPGQVLSILANLYNRQVDISTIKDWRTMVDFSEAFPSATGDLNIVQRTDWGYGEWGTWDYTYIRHLNLFIERCTAAETLTEDNKKRFLAEARFLRANYYFEMTKRMGGVPLILESMEYDFKGDPSYLQHPRAKESEMYDFVISEAEAIKMDLPADVNQKSRASRGAALAMQARAALYAGSIAKYNVNTPQVSLPGGEVGIPAAQANAYYTKALQAAQEIIGGSAGAYALYKKKPENLAENFASVFYDKGNNPESIFVEDFKLKSGKVHGFSISNQPRFGAEEEEGGRLNPSLNLVQSFELLNNTFAPLPVADGAGNPIYYTNQQDIFAGRDARLAGTVILPGTTFKGRAVDIWAGYLLADGSIFSGDQRGQLKALPGTSVAVQVVGFDGPINNLEFTAQSGFYIRKYLDPAAGSGSRGTSSEVPFIRYRYAEVLLNAAEAAFELNQPGVAAGYMNEVRARAGLTTALVAGDITMARIMHERRVELCFEGHVLFDNKRWRKAHTLWDGQPMTQADLLNNIGTAAKRNTQPWALWSYKLYKPGDPNNGKWVYRMLKSPLVTGANRFRVGNYYSSINNDILSNNPKIVRQPNQD